MNKIICAFFTYSLLFTIVISIEECTWSEGITCPLTAGSYPKCGIQYPKKVDDKYVVNICVSESPKMFGGQFDVAHAFEGKIVDIATGYLFNCGKGDGQGTRTFKSHCVCSGHCSITGTWSIMYEGASSEQAEEVQVPKNAEVNYLLQENIKEDNKAPIEISSPQ